jgi:hypothetical protein
MQEEIRTVADVPAGDEWVIVDGSDERDRVLKSIGEDPQEWSHGSLFVRVGEGEYTDVMFYSGNVPYLHKMVTRIL